jgi:hypothetical protein
MGVDEIVTSVRRFVPGEDSSHLTDKIKGTLSRLTNKGTIKHHSSANAYTLSKAERDAVQQKLQTLLSEQATIASDVRDVVGRIAESLEIDYDFDGAAVAEDALLLSDYFLLETGRSAAKAFESKVFFNPGRTTLSDLARELIDKYKPSLRSFSSLGLPRFLDLVPATSEHILKHPTDAVAEYLSRVADSYYLLFVLRQSPEVIQVVEKVVGRSQLLLDASAIVPCMAEILVPEGQRRMTLLLRAAQQLGVHLHIGQEGLNEILATVNKARAIFVSDQVRGHHYGTSELVEAFDQHADQFANFNTFLDNFAGPDTPFDDLKLFLRHHLGVEFLLFEHERARIDAALLEEMAAELRPARKVKDISDEMENILARNDVTCLLLIELLRKRDDPLDAYGFSWWWVTRDRVAYGMDRRRNSPKACACMSPDFLLRYLSVQPKRTLPSSGGSQHNIPLAVEVASIGLVPSDVKQAVEAELEKAEQLPKYMRIRKLRDAVHEARAPVEE